MKSIKFKLIVTHVIVIALVSAISLTFITSFAESYIISDTQRKLSDDAIEISKALDGSYNLDQYISVQRIFQKIANNNNSMLILTTDGNDMYSLNFDFIEITPKEFAAIIKDKINTLGTHIIRVGEDNYSIYITDIHDRIMDNTIGYVVLIAPVVAYNMYSPLVRLYMFSLSGASILAILIALVLSNPMIENIKKLKMRANLVANRRFDEEILINSKDEIGELALSIDAMADSIQEYDYNQKVFLQNASHELRTPLMSLRGFAEGLKDGVFNDIPTTSDLILGEVTRLEKLVEDVMYLTKIESSYSTSVMSEISIEDLIDESISRIAGIAIANGICVVKNIQNNVILHGDGEKLVTAFVNILSNGLRYAADMIIINVEVKNEYVNIEIIDDGSGINEEDLLHLFDRFYKGQGGKHGLGLSITKAIIVAHKGTISAFNRKNDENKTGAVFKIVLPIYSVNVFVEKID